MEAGIIIIFSINHFIDLLKKLLPHEYHSYLIRNGVRADSRGLTNHRSIVIKRNVLNQSSTSMID